MLFAALYLVISGVILLKKIGKPNRNRDEKGLFNFEKTSELIDSGIFKYIRHPLYSSLIFLTWGIFLKHATLPLFLISIVSTQFLFITSLMDEKECIGYFGEKYMNYMKRTKRFIPFLIWHNFSCDNLIANKQLPITFIYKEQQNLLAGRCCNSKFFSHIDFFYCRL